MTQTEIIDRVREHFIVQKNPPAIEDGSCVYRTINGHKCAVGIFIPDEAYSPGMEGKSAAEVLPMPAVAQAVLGHEYTSDDFGIAALLGSIQANHDNLAIAHMNGAGWTEKGLERFRERFSLSLSEIAKRALLSTVADEAEEAQPQSTLFDIPADAGPGHGE